jgi:hypothetical protein
MLLVGRCSLWVVAQSLASKDLWQLVEILPDGFCESAGYTKGPKEP